MTSHARATKLAAAYIRSRPELRAALGSIGFHFPRVVDANWRLDYYMKVAVDSGLAVLHEPMRLTQCVPVGP